jgi:tRNA-dihydrouridine synthase
MGLEGCMSGRMAMNTPWEVARIDREIFGDTTDTMTREEILLDYAEFAQNEQIEAEKCEMKLSNSILIRPLIYLFATEHAGREWRAFLTPEAAKKENAGKVK